jgi:hypothetical protein
VLESGTTKPITGAFVIGTWARDIFGVFHSPRVYCTHLAITTTSDEGRYELPLSWAGYSATLIEIYKPGYVPGFLNRKDGTVRMVPFVGEAKERLASLELMQQRLRACGPKTSLLPVYRAMYKEATGITRSREEKRRAEYIRASIDEIELGWDAVGERVTKGEYEK